MYSPENNGSQKASLASAVSSLLFLLITIKRKKSASPNLSNFDFDQITTVSMGLASMFILLLQCRHHKCHVQCPN